MKLSFIHLHHPSTADTTNTAYKRVGFYTHCYKKKSYLTCLVNTFYMQFASLGNRTSRRIAIKKL